MKHKTTKSYPMVVTAEGEWLPLKLFPSIREIAIFKTVEILFGDVTPGIYDLTVESKYFGLVKIYHYKGVVF